MSGWTVGTVEVYPDLSGRYVSVLLVVGVEVRTPPSPTVGPTTTTTIRVTPVTVLTAVPVRVPVIRRQERYLEGLP